MHAKDIAATAALFKYAHLSAHLQVISKPFCELAQAIAAGPPTRATLRALELLMDTKNWAVLAVVNG